MQNRVVLSTDVFYAIALIFNRRMSGM